MKESVQKLSLAISIIFASLILYIVAPKYELDNDGNGNPMILNIRTGEVYELRSHGTVLKYDIQNETIYREKYKAIGDE